LECILKLLYQHPYKYSLDISSTCTTKLQIEAISTNCLDPGLILEPALMWDMASKCQFLWMMR